MKKRFTHCTAPDCEKKHYCKGFCIRHYDRMSRTGRLDIKTFQERFWEKVEKLDSGCWHWIGAFRRDGYGVMTLRRRVVAVHRISWEIQHGEAPDSSWVLHRCDNKKCVNPDHLFLGGSQSNVDDMIEKGRQAVGVMVPHAKLTDEKVREIRAMREPHQKTADRYGVCRQLISTIKAGKKWKHVL